jgi:hypothetical protein
MSAETPNPFEPTPQSPEQHEQVITPEQARVIGHLATLSQLMSEFEEARLEVDKPKVAEWARIADPAHPEHTPALHADTHHVEYGVYILPEGHHGHMSRRERRRERKLADALRKQNTEANRLMWLKRDEAFQSMVRRKVDLSPLDVYQEKAHLRAERSRGDISRADYKHEMSKLKDNSHKHQAHLDLAPGTMVNAPNPFIDRTEKRFNRVNARVQRLGGPALKTTLVTMVNKKGKERLQPVAQEVVPGEAAA